MLLLWQSPNHRSSSTHCTNTTHAAEDTLRSHRRSVRVYVCRLRSAVSRSPLSSLLSFNNDHFRPAWISTEIPEEVWNECNAQFDLHLDRLESSGITSDVAEEVHIQVLGLVKPCLLVSGSQAALPKSNVNIFAQMRASQLYQNQVEMPPSEHTKLSPAFNFFPLLHTPNSPLPNHTNLTSSPCCTLPTVPFPVTLTFFT